MADLNALAIFAGIVEAGSFSEAARRLAMPVSTVSRRLAELEGRLGVRLLDRTTRSLRVTDVGAEVLDQARRCVDLGEAVDALVAARLSELSGVLRLAIPPSLSDTLLAPLAGAFQALHPEVSFKVTVAADFAAVLAADVDAAFWGGALADPSLTARPLLTYRHQLVASPAYLAARQAVAAPQHLLDHRLLAFARRQPHNRWRFTHVNGRDTDAIAFRPAMAMNDYAGLAAALLADAGIGVLPPVVRPELMRDGRLVEVMPDWRFRSLDLRLVRLGRRHASRLLRVFEDFAAHTAPTLFPPLPA